MADKLYNQAYYVRNKGAMLESQKARDALRKEEISKTKAIHYQRTKEAKKAYVSDYRKQFPNKVNALNAKHHAAKLLRTPAWLTETHWNQISMFYEAATSMKRFTEVRFEVDHIVPPKGKTVSGLHVPWNLQVLTESANSSKNNRI